MKSIEEKLKENYLLGCIKYRSVCNLYLMPIAYWILNYKKYDPCYNPDSWEFIFRDNILNVDDMDFEKFIQSVKVDKVEWQSIDINLVTFFIDFDNKLFVSAFNDIEVEEYLPNDTWKGVYNKPLNYLSVCTELHKKRSP